MWYATQYARTGQQLREKLYKKGYPREPVLVQSPDGTTEFHDMVEEIITFLSDCLMFDDEQYGESLAEAKKNSGKGRSFVRLELMRRGINGELAEEILDRVYQDSTEALTKLVEKLYRQERRRDQSIYELRTRVLQKTATRGWDFGAAAEVLDQLITDSEEPQ